MKKLLTLFLLLCLIVGCLGCTQPGQQQTTGQFIVHFIDLGQSDSILLEYEGKFALIDGGYAMAEKLLRENRDKLDFIAGFLLKYEVMDGEQFAAAMEEARVHLVGLLIERATVKSCDPTFAKFLLSEQEVLWPVPSTAERVLEVDIRVTE